jgi:methionyl aminopeptidase
VLFRRSRPSLKSPAELETMREAGRMVAEVLARLAAMVEPGVSTGDLNEAAADTMATLGGKPSFLGYGSGRNAFPAVICVSVDEEVVHGIPGRCTYRGRLTPDRHLEAGSVVSIDCGVICDGYHGDSAVTLPVGPVAPEVEALLETCRTALHAGIEQVRPGNRLTDVSAAIQGRIKAREAELDRRYGLVKDYVGHGIGRDLHEEPQVPNYVSRHLKRNDLVLEPGLVIAIEPMLCLGTQRTNQLRDGWTVVTRDGKPAAHFEHTVAVTEDGPVVFTARADGGTTH